MTSIHVDGAEETENNQTAQPSKRRTRLTALNSKLRGVKNVNKRTAAIVLLGLFLVFCFAYKTNSDKRALEQEVARLSSAQSASNEAEVLASEVGQHIELPKGEVPTVATVVDAEKVKGQEFFKSAKNGDKVLLFAKDGKAILYRPATSKIIEVAPINLGSAQQPGATPGASTQQ